MRAPSGGGVTLGTVGVAVLGWLANRRSAGRSTTVGPSSITDDGTAWAGGDDGDRDGGAGVGTVPVGTVGEATIDGRRSRRGRGDASGRSQGAQSIVAPMPGRVVRILVGPGDEVAVRQAVVVVEAMKMENELRSPKAGRVKDVSVVVGASVEAGRVLIVVE